MSYELNNTIRAIAQCEQAARELGRSLDKFAESGEKFRESADRAARLEKKISDSNAFGRLLESTGEIRRMSDYFAKNLPDFTAAMEAARGTIEGSQKDLQEGMEAVRKVVPGLKAMGQVGQDVDAIRKSLEALKDADLAGEAASLVQVQKDLEEQVFAQKGVLQQAKDLVRGQTASMEQAAKELQESLEICRGQAVQTESLIAANVDALRKELSAVWLEGQQAWGKTLDARQKEGLDRLGSLLTGSMQRTETLLEEGLRLMEEDLHEHMELQEEHLAAMEGQRKRIEEEREELSRKVQEGAAYLSNTAEASAAAVERTAEQMALRLETLMKTSMDRLIRSQEEQMADIRRRLDRLERMITELGRADQIEEHLLEVAADLEESEKEGRKELLETLQDALQELPEKVAAALPAAASAAPARGGSESGSPASAGHPGGAPAKSAAASGAAKPQPAAPKAPAPPRACTYSELLEMTPPFTIRKDNWKGDFCYKVEKISGSHIRGKYYKDGRLYPKLEAPDVLGTFYILD
ncbi:MAG: hypothetical protein E7223_00610 [Clostridiales bacterium]|nr:hypothetical protein [Clostridiales bacterium]